MIIKSGNPEWLTVQIYMPEGSFTGNAVEYVITIYNICAEEMIGKIHITGAWEFAEFVEEMVRVKRVFDYELSNGFEDPEETE